MELDPRRARILHALTLACLAGALFLLALSHLASFTSAPPAWPDEALFASPALDLLAGGPLRTQVWRGMFPANDAGTYYVPPLHLIATALEFALFGASLAVMRAGTLVCALAVLLVTYLLARRIAPSWLAPLAPALLALDPVFARGSRIGRMDMAALMLSLAAVYVLLGPGHEKLGGLLAGLALSVHPMAAPVVPIALALRLRDRAALARVALGISVACLPWLAWIARDPSAFHAQWAAQLIRKRHAWNNYGPHPWPVAFEFAIAQYPAPLRAMIPWLYVTAIVGLTLRSRALAVLAVLSVYALTRSAEMWYTLYATPFLPLGLCALQRWGRVPMALAALAFAFLAGREVFAQLSEPAEQNYESWSAAVIETLPHGARVLLAAIPDPYFATLTREDLEVREFLPGGIPFPKLRADTLELDFIVIGHYPPSAWVAQQLQRARLIATVGDPRRATFAQVFALH